MIIFNKISPIDLFNFKNNLTTILDIDKFLIQDKVFKKYIKNSYILDSNHDDLTASIITPDKLASPLDGKCFLESFLKNLFNEFSLFIPITEL